VAKCSLNSRNSAKTSLKKNDKAEYHADVHATEETFTAYTVTPEGIAYDIFFNLN
jgi:hypothetical protein